MMANELATTKQHNDEMMEGLIAGGDLGKLNAGQRTEYYRAVCESIGVNPLTRPFEYITLNGKLTLYARRDCTDQLRSLRGISVEISSRTKVDDLYVVTARAHDNARTDESIGAVSIERLSGEALANALMKAETKAKRRVTLSICGLGWSDETEVDSIPSARPVVVRDDGVIDAPVAELVIEQQPPRARASDVTVTLPIPRDGQAERGQPTRPYDPETVKRGVVGKAAKGSYEAASTAQRGFIAGTIEQLFPNIADTVTRQAARYAVTNYLLGKTSTSKLSKGECDALSRWMLTPDADGVEMIEDHAITEAARILEAVGVANGQQGMFEQEQEG